MKNVPFPGDRCNFFTKKLFLRIDFGNPLSKRVKPKHCHLMTVRVSTFNWQMIYRSNPLSKQTQKNVPDGCQTRSCHESIGFNEGGETLRERSGQPVANHDDSSHEQTILNEVNLDFRIPGLPHSVVKHAQSTRVRELIQKTENHPDRHALQQDLRQNQAYNPFSPKSKKMIQEGVTSNCLICSRRTPKRSAKRADEFLLTTGDKPNAYDVKETSVEPCTELLDSPPFFSDRGFPADSDYEGGDR